jgi:drug/metabolite transporter (DMT)-like permease
LAYFLLSEAPTPIKIFGAILILLGIYIASRSEARPAIAGNSSQ